MAEEANRLKVAAAQIAPTLMDKEANLLKVEEYLEQAVKAGADLIVFPECALTGYALASSIEAKKVAEPIPGPSTEKLERLCQKPS